MRCDLRRHKRVARRRRIWLRRVPAYIRITTTHAAKGGEADNVMLLTDMSQRSKEALDNEPDDEHRVFYVGATHAKQALHIIDPDGLIGTQQKGTPRALHPTQPPALDVPGQT